MAKIIFITGGERSGKSSFAVRYAKNITANPVYLATARKWDDDFVKRIQKHQSERDNSWINIEEEKHISQHNFEGKVVLLDCITLWLTNIFSDCNYNYDKSIEQAQNEWQHFIKQDFTLIVVTNEIGMGVHAVTESTRKFVELQGRINQLIASLADEAYLMISGISVKIK